MEQKELELNIREFASDFSVPYESCRPIPKAELVVGATYQGNCRNASEAVWNGRTFTYTRHKFGSSYEESIKHYEDDDGYDVFVPVQIVNKPS